MAWSTSELEQHFPIWPEQEAEAPPSGAGLMTSSCTRGAGAQSTRKYLGWEIGWELNAGEGVGGR